MTLLWVVALAWAGPAEAWLAAPEDATARLAFAVELAGAPATHVEGLVALERLTSDGGVGCAAQTALVRAGPPRWVDSGAVCPAAPRGLAEGPQRYAELSPDEQLRRLHADLLSAADVATWDALAMELGGAWGRAAEAAKAGANRTLGEVVPPTASWPPEGARLHAVARRDWLVAVALRPQVGPDYGGLGGVLWDELRLAEAWAWFEAGARRAPYDEALAGSLVDLVAYADLPPDLVMARTGLPADAAEALPDAVRRLREEGVDPALITRTMLAPASTPAPDDIAELARVLSRSSLPRAVWRWDPTGLYPEPAVFVDTSAEVLVTAIKPMSALAGDHAVQDALRFLPESLLPEPADLRAFLRNPTRIRTQPPAIDPSPDLLRLAQHLTPLPSSLRSDSRIWNALDLCQSMRLRWPRDRQVVIACADVVLLRGLIGLRAGDLVHATEDIADAVAMSPLARDDLWHRADPVFLERMAAGDLARAKALITPFVSPGLSGAPVVADRWGWWHLVRAQRSGGDDPARVADFAAALATHPAPALIGLHGLYARHGDVDMAIACLVELLELPYVEGRTPTPESAREQLVVYLARVGRPVDARSFARTDELRVRMNEELAWAALIGDARRSHGADPETVARLTARLQASDADTPDRLGLRGGAWLDLGRADLALVDLAEFARHSGSTSGAVEAARLVGLEGVEIPFDQDGDIPWLQRAAAADDDALAAMEVVWSPQRQVWLGDAWAARGELRKAEESYEAALVLHPEMFPAHIGLAWLDARAGRVDEAAERLREGFRRTGHPSYLLALSDVLAAAGRPDDSLLRALPDVLEVVDPRASVLPRIALPSGRAPLGPAPERLRPVPPRQPRWLKRMGEAL